MAMVHRKHLEIIASCDKRIKHNNSCKMRIDTQTFAIPFKEIPLPPDRLIVKKKILVMIL